MRRHFDCSIHYYEEYYTNLLYSSNISRHITLKDFISREDYRKIGQELN